VFGRIDAEITIRAKDGAPALPISLTVNGKVLLALLGRAGL
jgi:hypothetical protein